VSVLFFFLPLRRIDGEEPEYGDNRREVAAFHIIVGEKLLGIAPHSCRGFSSGHHDFSPAAKLVGIIGRITVPFGTVLFTPGRVNVLDFRIPSSSIFLSDRRKVRQATSRV